MELHEVATRIGTMEALDRAAKPVSKLVKKAIGRGTVKDLLSGTPVGHPLHPLLTDVPIGAFTSAALLDVFGGVGARRSADMLIATGLVAAVPTALSGAADWSDTNGEDTRTGLVHALANVAALTLYAGSLASRRSGNRGAGRLFGLAGFGALMAGGYLGGHLSFSRGVGVNNAFLEHGPQEWTPVLPLDDLNEGKPQRVQVGDATVLLVRVDGTVHAIGNRCSHAGGPLDEGVLDVDRCTVTCPWHQSEFRLDTGKAVHGPASVPQPAYRTRIRAGQVEICGRA